MRFDMSFSLDNDEASGDGALNTVAVTGYLMAAAQRISEGNTRGTVRDGNGGTIGKWEITSDDE